MNASVGKRPEGEGEGRRALPRGVLAACAVACSVGLVVAWVAGVVGGPWALARPMVGGWLVWGGLVALTGAASRTLPETRPLQAAAVLACGAGLIGRWGVAWEWWEPGWRIAQALILASGAGLVLRQGEGWGRSVWPLIFGAPALGVVGCGLGAWSGGLRPLGGLLALGVAAWGLRRVWDEQPGPLGASLLLAVCPLVFAAWTPAALGRVVLEDLAWAVVVWGFVVELGEAPVQAMGQARNRERLLWRVLDLVPHPLYAKDDQGRYVLLNQAAGEFVARPVEALLGKSGADAFARGHAEVLAAGGTRRERRVLSTGEGEARVVELTQVAFDLPGSERRGVLGLAVDVTPQEVAAQTLQAEVGERRRIEAFLQQLLNALPDPIFVKDAEHRWVMCNDAFAGVLGLPREEFIGRSDYDFFPREQADVFWAIDEEVFTSQREVENEEAITFGDGEVRTVLTKKAPFRDAQGRVLLVGMIRDVSARKEAERALAEAKAEAESATRAKSEFLANMSHEIRTPLNAVLGLTELLLDREVGEVEQEYLRTIESNGRALLDLISDILDFSKIESRRMVLEDAPVEVRLCVDQALDAVRSEAARKGLVVERRLHPGVPRAVRGDRARLRQVLVNLLGNAVKFTERGSVTLEVSEEEGTLRFAVRDTGIGIAPERLAELFEPFNQLDVSTTRRFGGTGLGLSISRALATAMGGGIAATSELGEGSTFVLEVPCVEVAAESGRLAPATFERLSERCPLRVLVAEDNLVNQRVVRLLLERLGYEVDLVADGVSALEAARGGEYDVVFMDMQMPELDGLEATRRLREGGDARTQVVALTAGAVQGDRERCLQAGMNDYLSKPVRVEDLKGALERAYARHQA